jgi:threonine/homoserine/homoserine lactone efflux protein
MIFQTNHLWLFIGAALVLVLTPGPNMIYLVSRTLCQGRLAGLVSLAGVIVGFVFHMVAAAVGMSRLFLAQPLAYETLKYAGALYLLWLAWSSVRPGGRSPFEKCEWPREDGWRLFGMGLLTNLLNPKIVLFYLSILPQFVTDPQQILGQSLVLGSLQIAVSFAVNLMIVLWAAGIACWLGVNPRWVKVQRYVMGLVLAGLALRIALQR